MISRVPFGRIRPISIPKSFLRYNSNIQKKSDDTPANFKVKPATLNSAPAPMDSNITRLMKQNNKPYVPKLKHERVSYDYPGLPNLDDFKKQPKTVSRWLRYFPKILTVVVLIWGGYTAKVWYFDSLEDSGVDNQSLLDARAFHKFVVTHKEQIDDDHWLIELHPKSSYWQYSYYNNYAEKSIWNGDRLWSVEVKQPEIMVVRSYTPLPLYFMKSEYTRSGERKPLLRVVSDQNDYDKNGAICLYVKRYDDGEVSRYITSKNIGEELELRGPFTDYRFPYHPLKAHHERPIFKDLPSRVEPENFLPKVRAEHHIPPLDNLVMYVAGTGIAPALQLMLTRNPYRGFVTIHYSSKKASEIEPLERFLYFLEKLDRVKLVRHLDTEKRLSAKDIDAAAQPHYLSPLRQDSVASESSSEDSLKMRMKILDEQNKPQLTVQSMSQLDFPHYDTALEQARVTSTEKKDPAALAIVCGPDGYVDAVAGPKDRARDEQGEVGGLLKGKGWDNTNVYKL